MARWWPRYTAGMNAPVAAMTTLSSAKKIGPILAMFMVANNMVGSGFFLLPASLARSGAVTAFSWLIGTILAVFLGGAFARLARQYPQMTSPDDYIRPTLGRDAGFLASTLYWLSTWIGNNAIAAAAFGYLIILMPIDDTPLVQLGGQVALIWAMFALNLFGPRPVARFQSLCVVLGLLPVAVILTAGWGWFDLGVYRAGWNVSGESDVSVVTNTLATVFWAFIGLETGAMVAGVVRDPDRNVPIATLGGILLAGAVYLVSSVLMMGIVPVEELAASTAPFALAVGKIFGTWAIPIIALAAALKATGTLGGWMLVTGESGARVAQRGYLPRAYGRMRPNGSAAAGLFWVVMMMSAAAFLSMSDSLSSQFETLINMAVTLMLVAFIAAGVCLMVGNREHPPGARERVLGIGALIACALLLWSTPVDTLIGAGVIAVLAWAGYRVFGRRTSA